MISASWSASGYPKRPRKKHKLRPFNILPVVSDTRLALGEEYNPPAEPDNCLTCGALIHGSLPVCNHCADISNILPCSN